MPKSSNKLTTDQLGRLIYEIRSERVMLDSDLASIYGVETKALNRAVKRNRDRFPKDFLFQLTEKEWKNLRYQNGTASSSHGGRRNSPYVFTEHGAIMAANVLNSRRAVQMNTTCGDAVGWTALSVWETGERSGERESTVRRGFCRH
jgi:ORF6N domain